MEYNNDKYTNPYDMGYVVSIGAKNPWTNINFGTIENNKIYNPYARRYFSVGSNDIYWRNNNFSSYQSLNFWQSLGYGANSVVQDFAITKPNYITSVVGSELIPNSTFANGDVTKWRPSSSEIILSCANDGTYDYMEVNMTAVDGNDMRTNNGKITTMKAHTQYEFSFDIKSDNNVQLRLQIADASAGNGALMSRPVWSNANAGWQHYSLPATTGDGTFTNMRVEWFGEDKNVYKLANISLKEVTYTITEDAPISRYYQNATDTAKQITVEIGSWQDLEGNVVSGYITLVPYSSIIVIPR